MSEIFSAEISKKCPKFVLPSLLSVTVEYNLPTAIAVVKYSYTVGPR